MPLPPHAVCLLPSTPSFGGFVPDFFTARSFVFKQIGGFVFQKKLCASRHGLSGSRASAKPEPRVPKSRLFRVSIFHFLRFVPSFSGLFF